MRIRSAEEAHKTSTRRESATSRFTCEESGLFCTLRRQAFTFLT